MMQTKCFVCGLDKSNFDHIPHGFDSHVYREHSMAHYMWVCPTPPVPQWLSFLFLPLHSAGWCCCISSRRGSQNSLDKCVVFPATPPPPSLPGSLLISPILSLLTLFFFSSQESYVWEMYLQQNWDFFPVGDCFHAQEDRREQQKKANLKQVQSPTRLAKTVT